MTYKLDKHRLMLEVLYKIKQDFERLYPFDETNKQKLMDVVTSVAFKIKDMGEPNDRP